MIKEKVKKVENKHFLGEEALTDEEFNMLRGVLTRDRAARRIKENDKIDGNS